MALALIENLQREDLNPVEEARAYQKLSEDEGWLVEIAKLVDKSRSHVANFQRLLALPDTVLPGAEGRSPWAMRVPWSAAMKPRSCEEAVSEGLSVRKWKRYTQASQAPPRPRGAQPPNRRDADIEAVQGHLEEFLGMP